MASGKGRNAGRPDVRRVYLRALQGSNPNLRPIGRGGEGRVSTRRVLQALGGLRPGQLRRLNNDDNLNAFLSNLARTDSVAGRRPSNRRIRELTRLEGIRNGQATRAANAAARRGRRGRRR